MTINYNNKFIDFYFIVKKKNKLINNINIIKNNLIFYFYIKLNNRKTYDIKKK